MRSMQTLTSAFFLLTVSCSIQAATYNAGADFNSTSSNPDGVWSYGYSTAD